MKTYKIIRFYENSQQRRVIATGLSLREAQEHCNNPETSSSTCTGKTAVARTRRVGRWFDGWTEE